MKKVGRAGIVAFSVEIHKVVQIVYGTVIVSGPKDWVTIIVGYKPTRKKPRK